MEVFNRFRLPLSDRGNDRENIGLFRFTSRLIVCICGLIVLFVGLWVVLKAANEALALYNDPSRIESLAVAIERGSNLDRTILSVEQNRDIGTTADEMSEGGVEMTRAAAPVQESLRLTYFAAWIIELLLLLLIARIGLAALKTGGELVLSEVREPSPHAPSDAGKSRTTPPRA